MLDSLRRHRAEYAIEAALLGIFMVSAASFGALLEHPASPLRQALPGDALRRVLMGIAMGTTAAVLIYSPWGKRSGAHFNPAVTLTFLTLGKVRREDAFFYVAFQLLGGIGGLWIAAVLLGDRISDPAVAYVVTKPGAAGNVAAFLAELSISFLLMLTVLSVASTPAASRWAGIAAACLVAAYISVEAPISGMSMNPARTLGSAVPSGDYTALWIYFIAPPLGMLAAGTLHANLGGAREAFCARLSPHGLTRCIFCGGNPPASGASHS